MRDQLLEAYVFSIERHLSSRRGAEHVLSPRDFALAREWHAAGVQLAAVLAGIDRTFERDGGVVTLQRCRRAVESSAGAASLSATRAEKEPPPDDLLARLGALRQAIAAVSQPAAFERPERRLVELLDLAAVAREPNWAYLRNKLEELDRLVDSAALETLPAGELERLRAEAGHALQRQPGLADPTRLEEARLRYLRRRARERFALPRVGGD